MQNSSTAKSNPDWLKPVQVDYFIGVASDPEGDLEQVNVTADEYQELKLHLAKLRGHEI